MDTIKLIIDRLLGMDRATRRRSIEAAALYVFTAIASCNLFTLSEQWQDIIVKIFILIVEGFVLFYESHYKNNDHTEIAAEHTGEMRQEKLEQDPDYVGERFYTEELGAPDIDELEDKVEDVESDEVEVEE